MKTALAIALLMLGGCDSMKPPVPRWKCFDGFTYEYVYGAWVKLDGKPYVGRSDGPIPCVEEKP